MLNLVQLQERLKDVPMQALMQYANGMNPQIPPFLALGELNRRKKMQESAAQEQAKEMAGAPSIKDQIEQAAGLMALQGSRQRQAAQQQQSAQQQAMMPAPNTTTSEPAQLAGGGYIDEVPRDYQAGGRVDPAMLKKLMMMKAMQKRRPGIAGIPINTFKRQDYAGGGIVAFAGPQGSEVKYDPQKDEFKEDTPAGSMGEFLLNLLPSLPKLAKDRKYKDPFTGEIISYEEYMARARDPNYKARASGMSDAQQSIVEDARDKAVTDALRRQAPSRPAAPPRLNKEAAQKPEGIAALPGKPGMPRTREDFMRMFEVPGEFDPQKQFEKIQEEKKRYGVSDQYLTDAERAAEKRMAAQQERRGRQGMDQAIEFLTSVAEGRGGNWATQGARGAKAAQKLRMEQEAANERQDEANDALRMALAEKRQALARGDMQAAAQAEKDIIAARKEAQKAQFDIFKAFEDIDVRKKQVAAMNNPVEMQMYNLWRSQQAPGKDTSYEAYLKVKSFQDENLMLRKQQAVDKQLSENMEYKILSISNKPEDRRKAEQIKAQAYAQAGIPVAGSAGNMGLPPGVKVTKE